MFDRLMNEMVRLRFASVSSIVRYPVYDELLVKSQQCPGDLFEFSPEKKQGLRLNSV